MLSYLLFDVDNQRVFNNPSSGSPAISLPSSLTPSAPCAALLSSQKCISDLLSEFPDVLSSDRFTDSQPCHQVYHHILTRPGPPVFAKSCCLDPEKLASAKAEFAAMEKAGIICRSMSP